MTEIHYTASWTYSVDGDVRNTPCGEDATEPSTNDTTKVACPECAEVLAEDAISPAQEREEREEAEYAADLAAGRI